MRNTLAELPVLLMCIRAGLIAGAAVFLLRLPRRLRMGAKRGCRTPFWLCLLFAAADALAALLMLALFAAALLKLNGGEPRLYACAGFAAGAAGSWAALKAAAGL